MGEATSIKAIAPGKNDQALIFIVVKNSELEVSGNAGLNGCINWD
jgi:hypothetical protein